LTAATPDPNTTNDTSTVGSHDIASSSAAKLNSHQLPVCEISATILGKSGPRDCTWFAYFIWTAQGLRYWRA
jgi:hypothetical protein